MESPAFAWVNKALDATIAASSEVPAMPASRLQQEDVSRHFRAAAGTSVNIDLTFGTQQTADVFSVLGTNITYASGLVQVKLSNTGLGNTDIWDSTALPHLVDDIFMDTPRVRGEDAHVISTAARTGWKYCRIIISDASLLTPPEAGLIFISTLQQLSNDIGYTVGLGTKRQWIDNSDQKRTRGNQTRVFERPRYRQWSVPVEFFTDADRWNIFEAMDQAVGASSPVLMFLDPSSTTPGRDSIYGIREGLEAPIYLPTFDGTGKHMYSRSTTINERL